MTLDELLTTLCDSCERHGIIKEDVEIHVFMNNVPILNFKLEMAYHVAIYLDPSFIDLFVKKYVRNDRDDIEIYL